jgi:hypothetical protein
MNHIHTAFPSPFILVLIMSPGARLPRSHFPQACGTSHIIVLTSGSSLQILPPKYNTLPLLTLLPPRHPIFLFPISFSLPIPFPLLPILHPLGLSSLVFLLSFGSLSWQRGRWPLSSCCGPHTPYTVLCNISPYSYLAFPTRLNTSSPTLIPSIHFHTTTYPFRIIQYAGDEQGFYSRPNQHPVYLPNVDIYPIRPHWCLYTSDPRILEEPHPWGCIQSSYPFNHHYPSTPLNGDCVKGIVLLPSDHSRFPVKVTFVTDYNAAGLGKLRSYTYCITLTPGVNIISWCTDSGFVYDPFPQPPLLLQQRPIQTSLSFPNFLDGLRKTYVCIEFCFSLSLHTAFRRRG